MIFFTSVFVQSDRAKISKLHSKLCVLHIIPPHTRKLRTIARIDWSDVVHGNWNHIMDSCACNQLIYLKWHRVECWLGGEKACLIKLQNRHRTVITRKTFSPSSFPLVFLSSIDEISHRWKIGNARVWIMRNITIRSAVTSSARARAKINRDPSALIIYFFISASLSISHRIFLFRDRTIIASTTR